MTFGEIILYTAEDGSPSVQLWAEEGTVWFTQAEIANLFQTSSQNITLHIKSIYAEKELMPESTCKELLQVRLEGVREIQRKLKSYDLNMILALERYKEFDGKRRQDEKDLADTEDIALLEALQEKAKEMESHAK